jgi:hypothetical protein
MPSTTRDRLLAQQLLAILGRLGATMVEPGLGGTDGDVHDVERFILLASGLLDRRRAGPYRPTTKSRRRPGHLVG